MAMIMLDSRGHADSYRTAHSTCRVTEETRRKAEDHGLGAWLARVELLPGNDDALPEFHQLLELLKQIMQSKSPPQPW